jgi:enoyl-CoA hydratase/carnithine racemase
MWTVPRRGSSPPSTDAPASYRTRTPVGSFNGTLSSLSAAELGTVALKAVSPGGLSLVADADVPEALVATRALLQSATTRTLSQQLDAERDTQSDLGRTHDYFEGVQAFLEKRPAQFKGE